MSGFKALNIESDDESDIEIDDTKEIQIEEALKLYQNALKYHAEGPDSYDLAAQAYKELFESEIFKYPESQTELQRIDLYGAADVEEIWDDVQPGIVSTSTGLDSGPSTLPQILHLSHKNYARFKLDALSARFQSFNVTLTHILAEAQSALQHFVQALDKDDSDLDLWRRTASVGEMLDSKRVARFCLESVLDEDDTGLNGVLSLPGLEEGFAGEQLRELVFQLQDQLSILQTPLSASKRKILSQMLKRKLHPYKDILERESALIQQGDKPTRPERPERLVLKAPSTWAELGDTLLRQLMAEQHGTSSIFPGLPIGFDLSDLPEMAKAAEQPPTPPPSEPAVVPSVERVFPTTTQEQFPGLDNGQPTAQPQIASADPSMQVGPTCLSGSDVDMVDSPTMTLPSRKRSGDAAGLAEGVEEGRVRSKRIRARDSNVEGVDNRQAILDANTKWEYEQQLNEFQAADDWVFDTVGSLFEKAGIADFNAARSVRQEMTASAYSTPSADAPQALLDLRAARSDIQSFLDKYNEQLANLLLHGGENFDRGQTQNLHPAGGLSTGSGPSKTSSKISTLPDDGVYDLLKAVNDSRHQSQEVAWTFIEALLLPGMLITNASSYTRYLWPEDLKTIVVRILVNYDESLFGRASDELHSWKLELDQHIDDRAHYRLAELVQSIFELHLDIYSLIKQPNSGVEREIVVAQGDRLQRWSDLAREFMQCRTVVDGAPQLGDPLNLRFLWATTFHISVSPDISQDHMLECMKDLRTTLVEVEEPTIQLQNNAVMPELSVSALDREISKLTTKDFFFKVTNQDTRDPAAVIESLEPLLEALDLTSLPSTNGEQDTEMSNPELPADVPPELVRFLQTSTISVRLLLWQRLRDAYSAISYKPMVVYCYLRMIRMVLAEMKSPEIVNLPQDDRLHTVLKCMRLLQDMCGKLHDIVRNANDALECVDETGLRLAVSSFGEILQLIQVFNVAEDSLRVGQSQAPILPNGLVVPSFAAMTKLLHEMQIHVWTILYALLKEAISQYPDEYRTPLEDRFDFLRAVHRNLGLRGICGGLNRSFVRMLKDEFLSMTHVTGYENEQAQVLYDLHRLNCFLDPSYELMEHKCTPDAFVDRGVALQSVDLLLSQASTLPIKELVKHPLRETIDKVHGSLPKKKVTDAIMRNREIYRTYLRSPIHPVDLYSSLKGQGNQLPTSPIPKDDALLAAKGWYFLMGHIALTKFRTQKRNAPSPTEDVDIAIAFFMQDLEYTGENWETWFRLAQAYDSKIEENVVWSAEKMNGNMPDIILLQRQAIHCYTMATALATRSAVLSFETSEKMTELYYEFGNRIYSSAREPFNMGAFDLNDVERFVSIQSTVSTKPPWRKLPVYTAVKFANALFRKALPGKSDSWMVHHMIGKCLWKMHAAPDRIRPTGERPEASRVISAMVKAIDLLPDKDRKPDGKKEPVLEPHYKLLSVVHKMLTSTRSIDLETAKEALSHTPYASKEMFPESLDTWVSYVLAVLKNLRAADKSNWYHRMIFTTANIMWRGIDYSEDPNAERNAMGAKNELTPTMFTKTMVLQVWRPESERAGRHFVYTGRYTRFFVKVLERLKDRAGLEQLARRTRRRPHDIFDHSGVWHDICTAYLRLLRSHANLAEGLETSSFSNVPYEDFVARKEPLEKWMQATETGVVPALDVLRDVQELKKLNSGLMKPGAIDDLIGDSYAHLFNTMSKPLWEQERKAKMEEDFKRAAEQPVPLSSPPRNHMMSLNHLMNLDGTTEAQSAPPAPAAIVPSQPDAAPMRRKVGVGRREIRSCAEACYQKTKTQAPASVVSDTDRKLSTAPRVQVLIERERPLISGEQSMETSAPGSVHDDADDESELSELEEEADDEAEPDDAGGKEVEAEAVRRPLFPGLATVNGGRKDEDASSEIAPGGEDDVEMGDGDVAEQGDEEA